MTFRHVEHRDNVALSLKLLAELELGVVALLLLTVVGLTLGAMPFFDLTNITSGPITTLPWLFLPYGVVLYAVSGFESIPEVREIFEATPDGRRVWDEALEDAAELAVVLC